MYVLCSIRLERHSEGTGAGKVATNTANHLAPDLCGLGASAQQLTMSEPQTLGCDVSDTEPPAGAWETGADEEVGVQTGAEASTLAENGCRIWKGCTDRLRYGRIPRWGKHELLHRFIYITANGVERAIFGDSVHHKCHERGCVNPDHLEAATARENTLEMHERLSLKKNIALRDKRIAELEAENRKLRISD